MSRQVGKYWPGPSKMFFSLLGGSTHWLLYHEHNDKNDSYHLLDAGYVTEHSFGTSQQLYGTGNSIVHILKIRLCSLHE